MKLNVLGSGDAFGSGGKFFTSFLLETSHTNKKNNIMVDCGASTIIAMRALGITLHDIQHIVITHFHGDHYAGLAWLALESKFITNIEAPISVYGPKGIANQVVLLMETLYPGSSNVLKKNSPFLFFEYESGTNKYPDFELHTLPVIHSEPAKPHAIKLIVDDKSFVYSGDTKWFPELLDFIKTGNLIILECFQMKGSSDVHITYEDLINNSKSLEKLPIYLTHLGPDLIEEKDSLLFPVLEDGMLLELKN